MDAESAAGRRGHPLDAAVLRVALWTSARDALPALARQLDRVNIVGEAPTLAGALRLVSAAEPDAMFVSRDELQPDIAAFGAALPLVPRPLMILIGDTPADALAAFEARALDFVARPLDHVRLQRAADRAREWNHQGRLQRILAGIVAGLEVTDAHAPLPEPLLRLREGGHVVLVRPSEIELIEACGNYVKVVTATRQYLHQSTMKQCLTTLHHYGFVRAHRRVIVNSRLVRGSTRGGQLLLQSGRLVRCGRLYRHVLHRVSRGSLRVGGLT